MLSLSFYPDLSSSIMKVPRTSLSRIICLGSIFCLAMAPLSAKNGGPGKEAPTQTPEISAVGDPQNESKTSQAQQTSPPPLHKLWKPLFTTCGKASLNFSMEQRRILPEHANVCFHLALASSLLTVQSSSPAHPFPWSTWDRDNRKPNGAPAASHFFQHILTVFHGKPTPGKT